MREHHASIVALRSNNFIQRTRLMDIHIPEHAAGVYSIWQIHLVSEREIVRRAVREHLFRVLNAPQVEFFAEPACKSRTFKHLLCILDILHIKFRH